MKIKNWIIALTAGSLLASCAGDLGNYDYHALK